MTFCNFVFRFAELNKEKLEGKYLRVRKCSGVEEVIRKYETEEFSLHSSTTEEEISVKCELCNTTKGRLQKKTGLSGENSQFEEMPILTFEIRFY